jgi:lipoyl-dependent peroxiredoxin
MENLFKSISKLTIVSDRVNNSQTNRSIYTAHDHTTGTRDGGAVRSSDGRLDIKLSVPGSQGIGTNPEQLFAAGWSACFMGAMKITAGKMKITFPPDATIDAEVDLCLDGDSYSLRSRLDVCLPDIEPEIARSLIIAAHQICPYSKATRGNIDVQINLVS